jgi:RNA polymerase sigma factor (sigma-70 family)
LQTLIQRLRRAAGPPGDGAPSDGQLLERWAVGRDAGAFELLLWRHGPMVLAACRRLLYDAHLAEDAFQATWLVLLRKAGSLRSKEAVGAWLHRVACRVALRARAAAARRAVRERPAVEAAAPAGADELAWRDLRPVLDAEIERLPEHYRQAFVLCCLEGKTHAEAARDLGCAQGTLSSWLARARESLRGRLARRGVTLGAALASAATAASAGVPPALVNALVRGGSVIAAGGAAPVGVVPARAAALAEEVLKAMCMSKIKMALVAAVLVVGSATGLLTFRGLAQAPPPPLNQNQKAVQEQLDQNTKAMQEWLKVHRAVGPRWEYKAVNRGDIDELAKPGRKARNTDTLTAGLNRLGSQGWELVAIETGQISSTYIFRRPLAAPPGRGEERLLPGVPGSGRP